MKERRLHQRFSIMLPASIGVASLRGKQVFDVVTSNVSAGGAFFCTKERIPEGARVRVRLRITNERLKELTGAGALVRVEGRVARSGPEGVAVCFGKKYEIMRA